MSKSITYSAPGRIDLSGGATDWCGGHTISMAINLRATAKITRIDKPTTSIKIGDLYEEYESPHYGTKLDLFKAVLELCDVNGVQVEYQTDIPKGSGLGGSAPLTVSTVFAVNELFQKGWNRYYMTELAQRAETLKLETVNGYQDQYTATFGGLIFMDFEGKECQKGKYSKPIEKEPYAVVENLSDYKPDFCILISIPNITRKSSDETNSNVSEQYLNGDVDIVSKMREKALLTQEAKKALVDGRVDDLYGLINRNNEIMRKFGFVSEDNERIISVAGKNGARACKTCGAGRGAVAVFASCEDDLDKIHSSLKEISKHIFKVRMDEGVKEER
ncbi:MAG: galactokinase family protein [Candidatus Dojkabacteria bacterium]|nr:galactokinase family protein [Candidatus Dojkabacteria bacterium]